MHWTDGRLLHTGFDMLHTSEVLSCDTKIGQMSEIWPNRI